MHSQLSCRNFLHVALLVCLAPLSASAKESVDYQSLSLTQAAQLIREGKISSTELVEALLLQAKQHATSMPLSPWTANPH